MKEKKKEGREEREKTLSPRAREASKTSRQKREDIAYTVNHTLVCGTKDILEPFFTNWLQKTFGSHRKDEKATFRGNVREWFIGEAAGDVGGVPVAIAFQRMAPEFMASVEHRLEGAFGEHFRKGAKKAAMEWAREHHYSLKDPCVAAREEEIYRYEMDHLPQAAIWTVSSIGINIGTQKILPVLTEGKLGNSESIGKLLLFKSIGAAVTAGALFAGRSASPRTARKWDRWVAEHIFSPAEKFVESTLGIGEPAEETGWKDRIDKEQRETRKDSLYKS